jgi:predicted transcriptional regulator
MSETRKRVHDHVATHPGRHFNALVRALDLAPGQVQYHLKRLKREDAVIEERCHGRTHYFTPEYDAVARGRIAVLRRETARDILVYLLDAGASDPATVADALGIARSTLEWHLDRLVQKDLAEKRRDARNRVTLAVVDPEEAIGLIEEITPSLPGRMVDRFTRLVDDLLAE